MASTLHLQQDERIHDELKNSRHSQTLVLGNCWIHSLTATSVVSHILSGEGIFADSMQKLRRLDLSQNALTEIPSSISILTNLREVFCFYSCSLISFISTKNGFYYSYGCREIRLKN